MFELGDPEHPPPKTYANILGGLLRKHFPGIVSLPSGGRDVAWSWKHYSYADDPLGKCRNLQRRVVRDFWVRDFWLLSIQTHFWLTIVVLPMCAWLQKYFKKAPGQETWCDAVLDELCRVRVSGMHYEARIQCVRSWHRENNIHMKKSDCRDVLMEPWQYLQVYLHFCVIDFTLAM